MNKVQLENVTKRYKKVEALKNLSIDCKEKEFLVILGPSGAGKTTTLRTIAGLEEITEGRIFIDGLIVNNLPPSKRDVAMVFENYALYPHKTVFENIAYPLYISDLTKIEIEKIVKKVASILEIPELLDRYPRQLSGGQKQRVALGRAIVRNPKVFLMDEPIAHLDAKLRANMRGELKHLQIELEGTFIYTTHDYVEAMAMADRIAIINKGILQQFDTPEMIYKHPINIFVADFFGEPSMNFIPCLLVLKDGKWFLKHEVFEIILNQSLISKIKEKELYFRGNKKVILGIRPEHIRMKNKKSKINDIKGNIYITEPIGEDLIVDIIIKPHQFLKVLTNISFEGNIGDTLFIEIELDNIHIFDAQSESSII